MKQSIMTRWLLAMAVSAVCLAQAEQPAVEDFKPASTNQPGRDYPQVNSEGRVRARISAPEAQRVQLDISAVKYDLVKDSTGVWTGDSAPQDEGFHYYQLWIDGAAVPDPNSLYFYGASRWGSGIEIPAKDQDFYALKNVPHGQVREDLAVDGHPLAPQAVDEPAVRQAVLAGRGVDARDPQPSEVTLALPAVAVRGRQRPDHVLVGQLEPVALLAPEALRQLEDLLVARPGGLPALDPRHGHPPPTRPQS